MMSMAHTLPEDVTTISATDGPWQDWDTFDRQIARYQRKKDQYPDAERWLVEQVFYSTHRKFLKEYTPHASVEALIAEGQYDCVTGTWLMGVVYQRLGFTVTIREANFHVYLLLEGEEDEYVVEATDPKGGLYLGALAVQQYEREMAIASEQDWLMVSQKQDAAPFLRRHNVFKEVPLSAVPGLYYYNMAIAAMQEGDVTIAKDHLQEGLQYYRSNRMEGFMNMLNEMTWENLPQDKLLADQAVKKYVATMQPLRPAQK